MGYITLDLMGKVQMQGVFDCAGGEAATVDMRGLSTGVYVVKITNEKHTDEKEIILQN